MKLDLEAIEKGKQLYSTIKPAVPLYVEERDELISRARKLEKVREWTARECKPCTDIEDFGKESCEECWIGECKAILESGGG